MITFYPQRQLTPLFCCMLFFTATVGSSQLVYNWNQVGMGDWTIAANWTPARLAPASDDILFFNSGSTETIINVPTQTVGQLLVSANTVLNLQAATAGAILTVSGTTGTDLQVDAGASLNITGTIDLTLLIAAGATASINGNMTFSGAPHRLDAASAGAIVFNTASLFTQGPGCTGSVFTAAGAANAVVFSNGSTMVQNAGGNPFGLAAPASKVVFQAGSLFKVKQNVLIATQGRTYANVEIDFPAFNQTLTGTSQPLTVHHLTITQGILNCNFTGSSGINIGGNIWVAAGQALHFNPPSVSTLQFNGISTQSVTNNGTLSFGNNQAVSINNSAGVIFNSPVLFNNTVQFVTGIVTVPDPVAISFGAAAVASGASDACFVDGRVEKMGSTGFVFPVGKVGFGLVPLALNNFSGASATTAFTVAYRRQSANSISSNMAPGIHHVSDLDHWTIENSGTDAPLADVRIAWNAFTSNNGSVNFITVPGFLDLIVAKHDPAVAAWSSFGGQGNTVSGSTAVAGAITWNGVTMLPPGQTAAFSLASTTVQNPLPVIVRYFSASRQATANRLEWKIGCRAYTTMQVQRSGTDKNFQPIFTRDATAAGCQQPFYFTDSLPLAGNNYYRLKLTSLQGGEAVYSEVLLVSQPGAEAVLLQGNTAGTTLQLLVNTGLKISITITDVSGRRVQQLQRNAAAGTLLQIDVAALPAGLYYVTTTGPDGILKTWPFVKQ